MKDWYAKQPKEELTLCNLCGASDFDRCATTDRYGLPVTAVRCLKCGLAFLNPRMTKAAYLDFYRDGIYRKLLSEFYGREISPQSIEKEQREYAGRLTEFLGPMLMERSDKTLLDIGGSTGIVADTLAAEFGLQATVLEPSIPEAQRAAGKGLEVILGGLEDYEGDDRQWDVVLLCQTVDHLVDISEGLTVIRHITREGGVFFVDFVQNCPFKVDHPFYLDTKTMEEYLDKAGFEVLKRRPSPDGVHVDLICEAA